MIKKANVALLLLRCIAAYPALHRMMCWQLRGRGYSRYQSPPVSCPATRYSRNGRGKR
jgi:hypothetical protein